MSIKVIKQKTQTFQYAFFVLPVTFIKIKSNYLPPLNKFIMALNNDNILLKEAWKVALNSALKCIDEIELAAKVLVKNSYLDLSELKYYFFGELETATVRQLH